MYVSFSDERAFFVYHWFVLVFCRYISILTVCICAHAYSKAVNQNERSVSVPRVYVRKLTQWMRTDIAHDNKQVCTGMHMPMRV